MTIGTQASIDCPVCGFPNRDLWDVVPTDDAVMLIHCEFCDAPLRIALGAAEGTIEAT